MDGLDDDIIMNAPKNRHMGQYSMNDIKDLDCMSRSLITEIDVSIVRPGSQGIDVIASLNNSLSYTII